jgi:iron(III) transport system ATP-binding protein
MASISIEKLRKEFGGHAVLQDLSLHIPDGAFFTLLGPSGCGKTTLLRCFMSQMAGVSCLIRMT